MEKRHKVDLDKGCPDYWIHECFVFNFYPSSTIAIGYLISILMSAEPKKDNLLYGCTLALCINSVVGVFSMHQQDYGCELLGARISCALKGLIYHKVSMNSVE